MKQCYTLQSSTISTCSLCSLCYIVDHPLIVIMEIFRQNKYGIDCMLASALQQET